MTKKPSSYHLVVTRVVRVATLIAKERSRPLLHWETNSRVARITCKCKRRGGAKERTSGIIYVCYESVSHKHPDSVLLTGECSEKQSPIKCKLRGIIRSPRTKVNA